MCRGALGDSTDDMRWPENVVNELQDARLMSETHAVLIDAVACALILVRIEDAGQVRHQALTVGEFVDCIEDAAGHAPEKLNVLTSCARLYAASMANFDYSLVIPLQVPVDDFVKFRQVGKAMDRMSVREAQLKKSIKNGRKYVFDYSTMARYYDKERGAIAGPQSKAASDLAKLSSAMTMWSEIYSGTLRAFVHDCF